MDGMFVENFRKTFFVEKFPDQGKIFFVENFHKSIFLENLPDPGKIFFVENLLDQGPP